MLGPSDSEPRLFDRAASIVRPVSSADPNPIILFTAFEPSGDAHAAPVIAALLAAEPDWKVYAWGGPRMEAAGAMLLGRTADDGTMGLSALAKVRAVKRTIAEIDDWAAKNTPNVHVPVDSPAANFPLCKALRKRSVKTVHLVAPQLWAWAPWRIRKLRARTDHVLCLLPFEEDWFRTRGVDATFIGHPVINRDLDPAHLESLSRSFPDGRPRLAIFPGSRTHEVERNLDLLLASFDALKARHPSLTGVVIAAREELKDRIRSRVQSADLTVQSTDADAAVHWCDVALAVSGTMSLSIARQSKPMVGVYRISRASMMLAKALLTAPYRLLPNIIAGRAIVPEFVPYAGGPQPIIDKVDALLSDERARNEQTAALDALRGEFAGHDYGAEAAALIGQVLPPTRESANR